MVIRLIAAITAATSIFVILKDWRGYFQIYRYLGGIFEIFGPLLTALALLFMLIPIVKLIAAVALFRLKSWAWITAVTILSIEFLIGLHAVIRMYISTSNEPPPNMPPPDPNITVHCISMGPTYIISIIAIISVVILLQKSVRSQFLNKKDSE